MSNDWGFSGNPNWMHPDNAETADGRVIAAALNTLAFEQRTANLNGEWREGE